MTTKGAHTWTPINVVSHVKHASVINTISAMPYTPVNTASKAPEPSVFQDFISPPPEPEIIIQGHTDEELDAAKKQAYQEGQQTATQKTAQQMNELKQQVEAGLSVAFSQIERAITPLAKSWNEYNQEVSLKARELAFAVAKKVATNALDEHAIKNIEQLVEQCMDHLIREPKVAIYLHTQHIETFTTYLAEHPSLSTVKDHIEVAADDSLPPTDCRMEWHQGGAKLTIEDRWRQVEGLLGIEPSTDQAPELTPQEAPEAAPEEQAVETKPADSPEQDSDVQAEDDAI